MKEVFVIECSGRPMAVLVSVEDYEKWKRLAKEQAFALVAKARMSMEGVPAGTVKRDVRAARRDLRGKRRRRKSAVQ